MYSYPHRRNGNGRDRLGRLLRGGVKTPSRQEALRRFLIAQGWRACIRMRAILGYGYAISCGRIDEIQKLCNDFQ